MATIKNSNPLLTTDIEQNINELINLYVQRLFAETSQEHTHISDSVHLLVIQLDKQLSTILDDIYALYTELQELDIMNYWTTYVFLKQLIPYQLDIENAREALLQNANE